jgi:geranylgeranyl pyrophosphate synthase
VNRRWGNRVAVRLGDVLLGKVFARNAGLEPGIRAALGRMIRRTCDGEICQTVHAGRFTLTEREYLAIVGRKTAALFRGACRLGARLAQASAGECRLAAHSRSWSSGMGCSCSSQFFPQFTRLVLSFTDNLRHTRNSFLTHPSLKV